MSARIASLVLAALAAGGGLPAAAQPPATESDQVITVQSSRVGASISLGGSVVPEKEVALAAQMPGRVEFLAGEEGDRFEEGDLLVSIDDDELLAQRESALAQLASADAALRNAGIQYNRELWAPNSPSKAPGFGLPSLFDQFFTRNMGQMMGYGDKGLERGAELHGFGTQLEQAQNTIFQAQSRIREIDAKLRDTRAEAPFDGVIVQKLVEVGDTVQPGQPLYKYASAGSLQLLVDVPARHVDVLGVGMVVPARIDVGALVNVRVAQVYPTADLSRHTVPVKFDIPPGAPARPGMYAEVWIPDPTAPVRNTPIIPSAALVRRGSLHGVFVVADDKRELRLVRVGSRERRGWVSILSGLEPGERILANPRPGMASGWVSQP